MNPGKKQSAYFIHSVIQTFYIRPGPVVLYVLWFLIMMNNSTCTLTMCLWRFIVEIYCIYETVSDLLDLTVCCSLVYGSQLTLTWALQEVTVVNVEWAHWDFFLFYFWLCLLLWSTCLAESYLCFSHRSWQQCLKSTLVVSQSKYST